MPGPIGQETDDATTAGASGSLNAKLRLLTTQLGALTVLSMPASGLLVMPFTGPAAVSGTITVGNSPNVGQTAGPWAVSGTVTVNPQNVGQTAGPWAVSGTVTAVNLSRLVTAVLTRPADTAAYAAGDQIASAVISPSGLVFANCARANGLGGEIVGAVLIDSASAASGVLLELWVLDTAALPNNDNVAFAPSDATASGAIGVFTFGSSFVGDPATTGNRVFDSGLVRWPYVCGAGSSDLYGLLVVRSGYTPVAAEAFTIRLRLRQN